MISPSLRRAARSLWIRREVVGPALLVALVVFVAAHMIVACTSTGGTVVAAAPSVDGATFVGSESCTTCHEDITKVFPGSIHSRLHVAAVAGGMSTSCESCHGPGSRHVSSGGGTTFARHIVNPGKSPEACFQCHVGVHAQFRLPSHHPVIEGHLNCVQCHDPHGHDIMKPAGGLGMARRNESCAECHREQARQFVFEHEAMREGCTTCHQPHGSPHDKLLVQRDANLCLKCHAQVPGGSGQVVIGQVDHSFFLRQGTCFSCHTAVHGSNIHPKLLH